MKSNKNYMPFFIWLTFLSCRHMAYPSEFGPWADRPSLEDNSGLFKFVPLKVNNYHFDQQRYVARGVQMGGGGRGIPFTLGTQVEVIPNPKHLIESHKNILRYFTGDRTRGLVLCVQEVLTHFI